MGRDAFAASRSRFRIGRVFKVLFYIVLTALILFLIAALFNVILTRKNGEPPRVFGYSIFLMGSDSMGEEMPAEAAILVRECDPAELAAGDVVTFRSGYDSTGQPLFETSRVTAVEEDADGGRIFYARGDQETEEDTVTYTDREVIGKAMWTMAGLGTFLSFIKTPFGLVICIAVPLFLLLIYEIINLIRISHRSEDDPFGQEEEEEAPAASKRTAPIASGDFSPAFPQGVSSVYRAERVTLHSMEKGQRESISDTKEAQVDTVGGFDVPAEEEDVPLERVTEPAASVAYTKPAPPPSDVEPLSSTREFSVKPETVPAGTLNTNHVDLPDAAAASEPAPASVENSTAGFVADLPSKGQDRFKIEGINVRVRPDKLDLSLSEEQKGRDISITVTRECTDVTVGSAENEVHFSMFRDEQDGERKVVIRRTNK